MAAFMAAFVTAELLLFGRQNARLLPLFANQLHPGCRVHSSSFVMLTQFTDLGDASFEGYNGFVDSGCTAGLQHASILLASKSISRCMAIICSCKLLTVAIIVVVISLPSSNNIVNRCSTSGNFKITSWV